MSVPVVARRPGHHRHIGLGRRLLVERDGPLGAHLPAGPEGRAQRVLGQLDRREVRAALRLGDDELSTEELDRITGPKDAGLDEPVVLDTGPAPRPDITCRHDAQVSRHRRSSQRQERDSSCAARTQSACGPRNEMFGWNERSWPSTSRS